MCGFSINISEVPRLWRCPACRDFYLSEAELHYHVIECHQLLSAEFTSAVAACPFANCDKVLSFSEIVAHYRADHKNDQCLYHSICGVSLCHGMFGSRTGVQFHVHAKSVSRDLSCPLQDCRLQLAKNSVVKCPHCELRFGIEKDLLHHLKNDHEDPDAEIVTEKMPSTGHYHLLCTFFTFGTGCGFVATDTQALQRHFTQCVDLKAAESGDKSLQVTENDLLNSDHGGNSDIDFEQQEIRDEFRDRHQNWQPDFTITPLPNSLN